MRDVLQLSLPGINPGCFYCDGDGTINGVTACPNCHGAGSVPHGGWMSVELVPGAEVHPPWCVCQRVCGGSM